MTRKTLALSDPLYEYLVEVSVREADLLKRLREETGQLENARMQISPEQGQFMRMLVGLMGAEKVLELGTFTGYSALCLAAGLPLNGSVITCDINDEWPSFAKRYWAEAGVGNRIESRICDANELLDELITEGMSGGFDFIFIDADKAGLDDYYEKSLQLVRVDGVIAVDNTLWSGKVVNPDIIDAETMAIRGFNVKVYDDPRVDISLVPIGDGLTLVKKRDRLLDTEVGGGLRPEFL